MTDNEIYEPVHTSPVTEMSHLPIISPPKGFGGKRGYAGMRICGYADMRICGCDMRICGYAGMRVRRTGLTNRFQKLINNSNKIIAVNTKNHSCEGVFICGKTRVDFHKTLTSIFSAYTTSIY